MIISHAIANHQVFPWLDTSPEVVLKKRYLSGYRLVY